MRTRGREFTGIPKALLAEDEVLGENHWHFCEPSK